MARILLISTATTPRDFWYDEFARMRRCAASDAFKAHTITEDPDQADVILFFEPEDLYLAGDIRRHPYARRYPDKVFVFDPSDRVVPFLPGIYASIQRWQYDPSRMRSGCFPVVCDHDWITPDAAAPDLLFSFIGDLAGIPVREAIARLSHPRALIRDTGSDPANADDCPAADFARFHQEFATVLARSKFSLCPRGAGTATFRLFETMKAGRVPVILSDQWVAPVGPEWASFALVVPEAEVRHLSDILQRHEAAAAGMGAIAREQWELWFSESALFHRVVEWCLDLRRARRRPEWLMRLVVLWQLLEPFNFRYKLIPSLRRRHRRTK